MHKNILSWSALIDNTNRFKDKDEEDFDFFDRNKAQGPSSFSFPDPNKHVFFN